MKTGIGFFLTTFTLLIASGCATDRATEAIRDQAEMNPSTAAVEQELRSVGRQYDNAWVKQDAEAFRRLLADDFLQIDPQGKLLSKADLIARARSGVVKFDEGT
jgi:hypothetical protein